MCARDAFFFLQGISRPKVFVSFLFFFFLLSVILNLDKSKYCHAQPPKCRYCLRQRNNITHVERIIGHHGPKSWSDTEMQENHYSLTPRKVTFDISIVILSKALNVETKHQRNNVLNASVTNILY